MYLLSRYNYLVFHLLIESYAIILGVLIFTVSFISRRFKNASFISIIGSGSLVIAIITFLHAITYKGMGLIPGYDANLPTQLWIVLGYIQVFAILFAILGGDRVSNFWIPFTLLIVVGLVFTVLCFLRLFPTCFVDGQGLTLFKRVSEYIIIGMYIIEMILLYRDKSKVPANIFNTVFIVLVLFALSGFMFTLYNNVYGVQNFLGHFIRVVSFSFLYQVVVIDGIQKPYNIVFSDLNNLSKTDGLTKLFNHRHFMEALEYYRDLSIKENKTFYLIVMDIDHFKDINDTYGHHIGDQVMAETGSTILKLIRSTDIAFRHGGDEFSIILYDTSQVIIEKIVERIKISFENTRLSEQEIKISMSGGVVRYTDGSVHDLLKRADHKLYDAKRDGRNRIYFDFDPVDKPLE